MVFWSSKSGISAKYSYSNIATFVSEPWSIFTGRPKSGSSANNTNSNAGNKVSVFIFDKRNFEKYLLHYGIIKSKQSAQDKQLIQDAYDILRTQVSNLAKMKHPNVLTLLEPLEEHSKTFMFVTEYVTGTLESVFQDFASKSGSQLTAIQENGSQYFAEDIVIRRGISQITNALSFIHTRALSVHLNLTPRNVFINENSDWKLSGFGHLAKIPSERDATDINLPSYDPRIPEFIHLQLDYTAPEIVFDKKMSCKSDYFSLGCLIYYLYSIDSESSKLINSENSESQYKSEYMKFERKISSLSWNNVLHMVPESLKSCMPKLMNRDVYARYTEIDEFLLTEFFQDPMIKTLHFLDDLPTKNNDEKLIFFNGLIDLLPKFPVTLLQKKFLPILLDLLTHLCADKILDLKCISQNLHLIMQIGNTLSQLSFQERICPVILNKDTFLVLLKNANICMIENLGISKEKLKALDFFDSYLKPLLTYVLDESNDESTLVAQEKLLNQMELIISSLDFATVKKFLLPLLYKTFSKTTSLKIKNSVVNCFIELIEKKAVDVYTCCDDMLPLFKSMKTKDPRILLTSLKLFESISEIMTDETTQVEHLLPLFWSFSMAPTLSPEEYGKFTIAIDRITKDIQSKHVLRLKENTSKDVKRFNESEGFHKIIEPPIIQREDPESVAAKKISVPAIQPVTRNERINSTSRSISQYGSGASGSSLPTSKPTDIETHKVVTTEQQTDLNFVETQNEFSDFVSANESSVIDNGLGTTYKQSNELGLPPGFSTMLTPQSKARQTSSSQQESLI